MFRGGSWDDYAPFCRSAQRGINGLEDYGSSWFGFRVVLAPSQ